VRSLAPPLRRLRFELQLAGALRRLPPRVGLFMLRARAHALRRSDHFSLQSAARPSEVATLLELARGRSRVVELGTGTAWSAIALALADPARRVISCDPEARPQRARYLRLAGRRARGRIELRPDEDSAGPRATDPPIEVLFIDSSHECEATIAAVAAWRPALAAGAVVVFHDYDHPGYPGVRRAVEALAIAGEVRGGLFVWRP
jgi:predicted O-methyltransferase YrrM